MSSPGYVAADGFLTIILQEAGFDLEREITQQRFFGTDLPVIGDVYPGPILLKGPDAATIKITPGREGETILSYSGDAKVPAQCVGQPALGVQADDFAQALLIAWLQYTYIEIY